MSDLAEAFVDAARSWDPAARALLLAHALVWLRTEEGMQRLSDLQRQAPDAPPQAAVMKGVMLSMLDGYDRVRAGERTLESLTDELAPALDGADPDMLWDLLWSMSTALFKDRPSAEGAMN